VPWESMAPKIMAVLGQGRYCMLVWLDSDPFTSSVLCVFGGLIHKMNKPMKWNYNTAFLVGSKKHLRWLEKEELCNFVMDENYKEQNRNYSVKGRKT
jgi:hypothetical protein